MTGLRHAGRMIVGKDNRRRIDCQYPLHHLPRIHRRPINGAVKELLKTDQAVLVIQKQAGEHLVVIGPQAGLQEAPGQCRAGEGIATIQVGYDTLKLAEALKPLLEKQLL